MKKRGIFLLSLTMAALLGGCGLLDRETAATLALRDKVQVIPLEDARNGARRYELRIAGDARYTHRTHLAAAMMAFDASRHCDGSGISIDMGRDQFAPDQERPAEGQALAIKIECTLDRLPNHRTMAANERLDISAEIPEGSLIKQGSVTANSARERRVDMANRAIGSFVREAYTEDCQQGPLVIERIVTATEERAWWEGLEGEARERAVESYPLHVVVNFRCLTDF